MRRWSLWLAVLGLTASTTAFAQRTELRANKQELSRFASAVAKDYKASRNKALKLAKKNDWVIEKTFSDGSRISLQGIDAQGMPIYYITYNNTRAAATVGTDQVWAGGSLGLALSGAGAAVTNKLGVWDGGRVRQTHQELKGRVTQKDNPSSNDDHATHVAGTMMASGVNPSAKGMAFGNKMLMAYDFNGDVSEMASAAAGLLVSNHSYGSISGWRYNPDKKGTATDPYWEWWGHPDVSTTEDYKFGYYDSGASAWDKIAFDAPYYLIVKSSGNNRSENGPPVGQPFYRRTKSGSFDLVAARPADMSSNDGYDIISTSGTAKNILTVGAVNPIPAGYSSPTDVQISTFSSWGPTDDGRIKPDIVGNGVQVMSSVATGDDSYGIFSGTSMSSPNVSGSLLLLQEHYANLMNGNVMRAATLKGLAIHTADEAGTSVGPDYIYGWGLLNMGRAATLISEFKRGSNPIYKHLLEERQLAQDQTQTIDVVASGAGPLKVTIAWTDPEAAVISSLSSVLNNRTPRLVNDLDVQVLHNGKTYQAWTLNPANPAAAAVPGNNTLDNVEQVYIANAVPGETYSIKVSHKGFLAKGPQAFSMLASGVGGNVYCTSVPTSDQGTYIQSIAINNAPLSPARAAGCAAYTNYTEHMFAIEPAQSKTITIQPATCTTQAPKIAKVFIDWNANGSFADANELVAVSGVVTDNTAITATITAPDGMALDHKVRMRVILAETTDAATISPCGNYSAGETQDYVVQLAKPARELATLSVEPVNELVCANPSQAVRVKIRNNGAAEQSNIPVKVTVLKNGASFTQLSGTYRGILLPSRTAELVLTSFATEAGATYTITAEVLLPNDVVAGNNKASYTLAVSQGNAAPQASIFRCGHDPNYSFVGSGNGTVFWYKSATDTSPVAAGNELLVPEAKVSTTMYAALNDLDLNVGIKTKSALNSGGYNQFTPDVFVKTHAPVIMESARLYIGNSGKITFTVYNKDNVEVSKRVLDVTATRNVPLPGNIPDDPNDKGEVYFLGLELPAAGDYRIAISYDNDATIYRNNQSQVVYPMGVNGVFTITGNSASPDSDTYYYYFYDLKVKALGCKSERVAVQVKGAEPLAQPVITRTGHTLYSSAAEGNQWYLNGQAIPDATGKEYTPTKSGDYSVVVGKDGCVSENAQAFTFDYEEGLPLGKEFIVYPNPSAGEFTLKGEVAHEDVVTFTVYDMLGHELRKGDVSNFNGIYKAQIDLSGAASGMYLLRIYKNNDVVVKRLVIQH
ncbi:S8 family serine peptidase [Pontibacter sp. Tf4]|uniref:S8 family serine peptidase n=1 Tax=Pontibacter sp. Tf4 TaxID=2761620 RepID=UPI00162A6D5A|nr:S8 family serine peptidase [Pontibacter sp. Tf4]MBB6609827.1 S8 family serine peptidase [Pontibacter sp. Tf4]